MLKKCNLSVENAKAINQYSNGSNMILAIKKGKVSKEEIQSNIKSSMTEKLQLRGMPEKQIEEVQKFVETLDLEKPVYENYGLINVYVEQMNISKSYCASICTSVLEMNKLTHIDETIEYLDEGLSKARLPESMKLYRAVKFNNQIQAEEFKGKSINNNGYTGTFPLYDFSFAKYDDYDNVIEIYAPKGTRMKKIKKK